MFKKTYHSPAQSELFDERTFFKAFSTDMKRAKCSVAIESLYITIRRAKEFANLVSKCKSNVRVIVFTRNPDHHDGVMASQSIEGMKILRTAGIQVVECDDLRHRKLAIIDEQILWEGSLNMLSNSNSREMMRRDKSSKLCLQVGRLGAFTF